MTRILPLALLLLAGCAPVQRTLYEVGLRAERDRGGLSARTVDTPVGEVAYLEREADGPALVLLHGFGASKDSWVRLAPHLPDSLRLVVPDLLGHGASPFHPDVTYDVAALVDGLAATLDALGLGRFHLAGNSLGGLVATRFALAHPARVERLILLAPAGVEPPEPGAFRERLAAGENPLIPTTPDDYERLVALAFAEPPDLPWPAEAVLARDYAARAPQNQKIWDDINDPPDLVTADLPRLAVPTLLLFGGQDRVIHPSSAAVWAERVPDLRAVVLPGVGHAPMLEAPRTTARYLLDFLRPPRPSPSEL